MSNDPESNWDKLRYIPKPGEPELPPQLNSMANKEVDDVIDELNRLPFFMTEVDDSDGEGGSNVELEALKTLAYEGDPEEIATNFKNQGNERFKAKQYKLAIEYYDKALAAHCEVPNIEKALYANRGACQLELKNYRKCINDCTRCLQIDSTNVKALFRTAKALLALDILEQAKLCLNYALSLDEENVATRSLLKKVQDREDFLAAMAERRAKESREKEELESNLKNAFLARDIRMVETAHPPAVLETTCAKLEDPRDLESQMIYPAVIMYPITDEFDFVGEVSELSTPLEVMELLMQRPAEWFEDPKHAEFKPNLLNAYMETVDGGLIKLGKKMTLHAILSNPKPKVPLIDKSLLIYLVPRSKAEDWLKNWNRETTIARRK